MKTNDSLHIFDIDALTSVLEIARTASYSAEMERLIKLAILSSSPAERASSHFKDVVVAAYRGAEDSVRMDLNSLHSDWTAVGGDICTAMDAFSVQSEALHQCSHVKWKNPVKSRMKHAAGCEKYNLR
ncbi:hypothetical protein [Pseudomonas coronafaciens]|uniref:hypothetical protein n=1 Tax=Pseudomonas coronafaciens TaxID=53409 RepID=UPI000EFE26CF|nr:hypothetical protein [Pseudomonas coronafaciens]